MTSTKSKRKQRLEFTSSCSLWMTCGHGRARTASLGPDEGPGLGSGNTGGAEVTVGCAGSATSLEEDGVLASWGAQGQLIKGQDLSSGLKDAFAGLLGHMKSNDSHLGDGKDPGVVSDGADDDCGLSLVSLHLAHQPGDGERWPVGVGHEESSHHDLIEFGVGTTGQELVQLDEQAQVDVIGLWPGPADLTVLLVTDVNTHGF